jgi:hypothetical protein
MASASRRLRSLSLSASASSSASDGSGLGGAVIPPTKLFTLWTKLAARLDTEDVGEGDLRHRSWSGCCSSSEPKDASAGSTPVDELNVKVFLRGDGGRGVGLLPSGCEHKTVRPRVPDYCYCSPVSENSESSSQATALACPGHCSAVHPMEASSGTDGSDDPLYSSTLFAGTESGH